MGHESDDLRQFIRDMNTRFEKRHALFEQRNDAVIRRLDAQTAALHDMRAEIRANTQGLLRVLDELRGSA